MLSILQSMYLSNEVQADQILFCPNGDVQETGAANFLLIDGMSDEEVLGLNIPTGVPLVYELDENLKPISKEYLGDADAIKAMMDAVAKQGKAK